MKSAGWYLMHEGRRLWAATKREAHDLARQVANKTGKPVAVRPAKTPTSTPPAARKKPVKRTMRRNPDPLAFLDVWTLQERHKEARREFGKRTKARRLAKGMHGRRQSATKTAEAAKAKTGKFRLDARKGKRAFTLFRSSRGAAIALADAFKAEGFDVALTEV